MKRRSTLIMVVLAMATFTMPVAAGGDLLEEAECRMHEPLSVTRLLRRTSLGLLGRIPTMDEYAQVSGASPTGPELESVIDLWLEDDAYRETMRRYHLELLWTNPDGAEIMDGGHTLFPTSPNSDVWWLPAVQRSKAYRGGDGTHTCQDVPQTDLEPSYQLGAAPYCEPQGSDNVGAYCQEGWVLVTPFFDPNETIKVCAFEAQTDPDYVQPQGSSWHNSGTVGSCDDRQSRPHQECGCGPNLRWCLFDRDYNEADKIWSAMMEQLLRLVDDHTSGDKPYPELLTTKDTYSVGVLDHYLKYQAQQNNYTSTYNRAGPDDAPPLDNPDWTDPVWHKQTRSGVHAGILTQPAFLLRYQTARARANRFRISFLGKYFTPPSGEAGEGCSDTADDLTQRCTCQGCHQTLEPLASYFGAFAEAGSALISHYDKQVDSLVDCASQVMPGSNGLCARFYKAIDTPTGTIYRRNPLEFVDAHPEYDERYDAGPAALVADEALAPFGDKPYSHLAWATTRNLFNFLVHREIDHQGDSVDEQELLDELATQFEMGGFNFKQLAKSIIMTEAFRRMP